MKKPMIVLALVTSMSIGLMTGCGEAASTPTPVQVETPTVIVEEPTIEVPETVESSEEPVAEEPELIEEVIPEGMARSHLTNEIKDEAIVNRRNIAVMIPNNSPAMPQYGISYASIIYEAPVEGRITRLMAIFEDYDDLDRIGPIRSSRDYFIYESMAYDSIYCNWGLAVPYVADLINSDRVDNISQAVSGISSPSSEAFDRVSRPGYATEFTGYMFIKGLNKAINRHKYETEYRDTFEKAFTFATKANPATYDDKPSATKLYPGGTGSNKGGYGVANPYFEYNEEDGLYYRYQYDKAQIDEINDEQLAVTNVIFKICHGEVRDDHDYLAFGVHGTGDAYVFTNGKVIKGTWQRNSDYEPNLFFDEDGNEIVFNEGKTWFCNIWLEYEEYMKWE